MFNKGLSLNKTNDPNEYADDVDVMDEFDIGFTNEDFNDLEVSEVQSKSTMADILEAVKQIRTNSSVFLNFTDSPYYYVKITGVPEEVRVHFIDIEGGKKKKVDCEGVGCPYCPPNGKAPTIRFHWKVEDRDDMKEKTLICPSQLFDGIKKILLENPNFHDYYIKVEKTGFGIKTKYHAQLVI